MDLRDKPGKIQQAMELLLRFRLISLAIVLIASVSFVVGNWQGLASLPNGASEALGMWVAEIEGLGSAWVSAKFLAVAGVCSVALYFVFGGIRGGISGLVSFAILFGTFYVIGGNERLPLVLYVALLVISMACFIFVKVGFACGLLPFAVCWVLLTGLMGIFPEALEPNWLVWGVLSVLGASGAMPLSSVAGKYLAEGMPKAGALVRACKKMILPMTCSSFVALGALAFDMPAVNDLKEIALAVETAGAAAKSGTSQVWGAVLYYFIFNVWFFAFLFPVISFGPWNRLRSGSRRVEMKPRKKAKK